MPQGYHHLTYDQRCQIYVLKKSGKCQTEIAMLVETTQSTINKELKRNNGKKGYRYKQAHAKSIQRRFLVNSVRYKMTSNTIALVEKMLYENQ